LCAPSLGWSQTVNDSTAAISASNTNATSANPINTSPTNTGPGGNGPGNGGRTSATTTNPAANSPAINSPAAGSPASNTVVGQALSSLRDGAGAQQGVPVPRSVGQLTRRVSVQANTGITYDSNVRRTSVRSLYASDLSKDDFLVPLGVDVDLLIPSGGNIYSLQGRVGYDFYLRNSRLNSEEIALTGAYQRQISRCSAGLNGSIARNRTRFNEAGIVDLSSNIQTTENIGASLSCSVTTGLRPFGSFGYIHATNSQSVRSYSDHDTKTFGGGIVNAFPTLGELGVVVSMEDTDYPDRLPGLGGAMHLRVKSIGGSFNRMTARILQASLQLNYTSVDDGQPNGSFKGLSGNVLVRYMPGGRFTFTFSGSRSASPSLALVSDYNLLTSFNVDAAARINSRAQARLGFGYVHRKVFGAIALPGVDPANILTTDNNATIDGGLNYLLNRRISLFLSVVHERRTANTPVFNYSGTRGTIGVNFRVF
jgi:hypothetical protein